MLQVFSSTRTLMPAYFSADRSDSIPEDLLEALQAFLNGARGVVDFQQALLFGSRARGDARADSDVDVALIVDNLHGDAYDLSMRLADLSADVLLETEYVITPVLIAGEFWEYPERHTNPEFIRNVKKDGIFL